MGIHRHSRMRSQVWSSEQLPRGKQKAALTPIEISVSIVDAK